MFVVVLEVVHDLEHPSLSQEVLSRRSHVTEGHHTGRDHSWTPGRLEETQYLDFEDLSQKGNRFHDDKI